MRSETIELLGAEPSVLRSPYEAVLAHRSLGGLLNLTSKRLALRHLSRTGECSLGSGLIDHSQKMIVAVRAAAARAMAERKTVGHRS